MKSSGCRVKSQEFRAQSTEYRVKSREQRVKARGEDDLTTKMLCNGSQLSRGVNQIAYDDAVYKICAM